MNGIIYYIYHIESGKGYIGKHNKPNLYSRFKSHSKKNIYSLGKDIRKYGQETFKVILLDVGNSHSELWKKEIYWIDRLETLAPNGYNLTTGGEGCIIIDEQWRENISRSLKGRKLSKEAKINMSLARKGTKLTKETKLKISESNKGKHTRPLTQEWKNKISESTRKVTKEQVQMIRNSPEMSEWDWATKLNISRGTIHCIRTYRTFKYEP